MQLTPNSRGLLQLLEYYKRRAFELGKLPLQDAKKVSSLTAGCGFGEVATLTNTRLLSSIVATSSNAHHHGLDGNMTHDASVTGSNGLYAHNTELIVIPKEPFSDLVGAGEGGNVNYEAIDFLRQSGLGALVSVNEMVEIAGSMTKRTVHEGDCLFAQGIHVESVYFVVSGEILVLVNENRRADQDIIWDVESLSHAIVNTESSNCYSLIAGSILGNEALLGSDRRHMATALVSSKTASVFEVKGFGIEFLANRLEMDRFTALTYRDMSRWDPSIKIAENKSMQTFFDTLQRAMARRNSYRGVRRPADVVCFDITSEHQQLSPANAKKCTSSTESETKVNPERMDSGSGIDASDKEGNQQPQVSTTEKHKNPKPATLTAAKITYYPHKLSLQVKHYLHTLSKQVRAFEMNSRGALTESAKVSNHSFTFVAAFSPYPIHSHHILCAYFFYC